MSETIREKIIQQIVTRLAVITTTNGYNIDLGASVERVRKNLDPSDLPACVVFPQPETVEPEYGVMKITMPVRIEGLAAFWATNPSVIAEQILGDLIKAMTDPTWDRRRLVTSPASPVVYLAAYDDSIVYKGGGTDEYPNDEDLTVGASALFEVTYSTKIGNPYEQ
jgi:hypothetical protein